MIQYLIAATHSLIIHQILLLFEEKPSNITILRYVALLYRLNIRRLEYFLNARPIPYNKSTKFH